MSDHEDLFDNPFFIDLKNKFSSYYKQIQNSCYLVLVPSFKSVLGMKIDKYLIGML